MQRFTLQRCLTKSVNLRGKYDQADEPTLIKGCLQQHAAAQKVLYERYSALMMGVCYRYVQNRADAEDILQDGFVRVFTHLGQFRSEGSLEGWIRRIMVNTAINFLNRNKNLQQMIRLGDAERQLPGDQYGRGHEGGGWMELLQRLPVGYKTIVNLYAVEGYSHKEISVLLGIAESTSRSQYARAKALLIRMKNKQQVTAPANKLKDDA